MVKVLGKGSFGVVRLVKDLGAPSGGMQNPFADPVEQPFPVLDLRRTSMAATTKGYTNSNFYDCKLPPNDVVYAMKVIRKADMLRNAQEAHLRAERNFLVAAENSKWVIPLITAFQDTKHLYLVMNFCIGGDFLGLLIRKNVLSEQISK